ncbi:Isonitrile hydratase [Paenibacillus sp. P1XP2]|nr:Isonitrile hydratase [Paenibacillus sp. P1XP2]
MLNVQIVLFDGFDLLDAIAPFEVFSAASLHAKNAVSVQFVTAEGPRSVTSGINGLNIEASGTLDPEQSGIILVPGASGEIEGDGPDSIPAILGRAVHTSVIDLVARALGQQDVIVATVCGGSLLLAMGGLLEDRPAVTHHLGMELLGATGAVPVPARVVDHGNLVTGGGVTSGLDVSLYLVERELGPRIAHAVERLFEYERRGTVWRETGMALGRQDALTGTEPSSASDEAPEVHERPSGSPYRASLRFRRGLGYGDRHAGRKNASQAVHIDRHGTIRGKATQGNETVEFINPVLEDNMLTWMLRITKPMRLHLKFEVAADGDQMVGIAKAGMLPASKLTGMRIS